MKLPLAWLSDFVSVGVSASELAERLTMSGSLVEQVSNTGKAWESIVVAKVRTLDRHPNADTLWLAGLDLGGREQTVVTGAQNLRVGALVAYIPVGATLPGQQKPLEPKMLRGVRSEGMVCSGRELGLNDDHDGILLLDSLVEARGSRGSVVGRPLSEVLGEIVLDLDITPNRPDCLSVYGLAREVAAVLRVPLAPMPSNLLESDPPAGDSAWVRIDAPDLCSRITARVIENVTVGPSPAWMVERLRAAGMRSINNVVDITNYVMLEFGQPLHAYDLDRLAGNCLIVRRAHAGESITTLDGVQRTLTADMLVIADDREPIGIAGVMGSAPTEVNAGTKRILLEAATFNGRSIRRTAIAIGLRSEASSRFEKGLPERLAPLASARAAALIAELAGGSVARGLVDSGYHEAAPQTITFATSEVKRLLGVDWDDDHSISSLQSLGFVCAPAAGHLLTVEVPWWRQDIDESADLVEEVARVTGFDAIPATLPEGAAPPHPLSDHQRWYPRVRQTLLACGLNEGSSPALTPIAGLELLRLEIGNPEWLAEIVPNPDAVRAAKARFEPVRIVNPLSPDREFLRSSLLPGLLDALRDNLRAGEDRATFFELDFCSFARPAQLPLERRTLGLAMAGLRTAKSWVERERQVDFFDLKGIVEKLAAVCGIAELAFRRSSNPILHPGRSATVLVGDVAIGHIGELHPLLAERWDLGLQRPLVGELDFEALAARAVEARTFAEFSRLPIAKRDLAIVVDESVEAGQILAMIRQSGKDLVKSVKLFDVYRGEQLPAGKKSLAVALDLQAMDHTLADEEIDKVMGKIQRTLQHRAGAQLRA